MYAVQIIKPCRDPAIAGVNIYFTVNLIYILLADCSISLILNTFKFD